MKKTAKSHVVGKHPKHAKQTSPAAAHLQHEINSLKRAVAALSKHHHPPKKHHHAPKKHHKPAAKKRGLALGDMAACCAAEALAASLRLSGRPVADEDVLALYARTAADLNEGASILETLEAAWLYGLGGVRPTGITAVDLASHPPPQTRYRGDGWWNRTTWKPGGGLWCHLAAPAGLNGSTGLLAHLPASVPLILGLELPGPHTVLATPDGWWSWGELHDPSEFPDAVIEEAWAISWQ